MISAFRSYRRQLIDYCLYIDPDATGYINQRQLTDFCFDNKIIRQAEDLNSIMDKIDPQKTGRANYFRILYEVSLLDPGKGRRDSQQDETIFDDGTGKYPHTPGGRKQLDPSIFGESTPHREPPSASGARRELDSSIFGEKSSPAQQNTRGGRTELDPSIFGEKVEQQVVSQAPAAPIDLTKSRDCTDFNVDQTLSIIARVANAKFRTLRDCFGNWRGAGDRLTPDSIYRGMVTDGQIELNPIVVAQAVEQFGDSLTVSSFTRLVSEGARINAPEPVHEAPPPLTERDILLNKIAESLKGKKWEISIKNSKNSLDLTRNLKSLGVNMKSEELRSTFETLGIKKIVAEIKQRQEPPKKRSQMK